MQVCHSFLYFYLRRSWVKIEEDAANVSSVFKVFNLLTQGYHFVPCCQKSPASSTCELFLSQSLLHLLSLGLPSSFVPRLSVCLRCGSQRGRITNPDGSSREDCWRESADRYCRASARESFAFAQKTRIAAVSTDTVLVLQNKRFFFVLFFFLASCVTEQVGHCTKI